MRNYRSIIELKDLTVLRYLDEINFDDADSIYVVILRHLFNGDFNKEYTNKYLEEFNIDEKIKILNNCSKYSHLVLLNNDYSKYDESIDSYNRDRDYLLLKVLDDYDFLIRLYLINSDILDELTLYGESFGLNRHSVIEELRNDFLDDEILVECLNRMVSENKYYNLFDESRRSVLYDYPYGLLFAKYNNRFISRSVLDVATGIYNYVAKDNIDSSEVSDNPLLVNQISKFLNGNLFDFKDIIIKLNDEFYKKLINIWYLISFLL